MVTQDLIKAGTYQITKIEGSPKDIGLVFEEARFVRYEDNFLVMAENMSYGHLFILVGKVPVAWYTVDCVDGNYLLQCDWDPPVYSSMLPVHKKFKVAVQKDDNGLLALQITDADDQHKLTGPVKIYLKYISNSQQFYFGL